MKTLFHLHRSNLGCSKKNLVVSFRVMLLALLMLTTISVYGNDTISNMPKKEAANSNQRGIHNDHEWVDLGLPSGTLWASCNIGATTPEGYGDYFAWGETEQKDEYKYENNKYSDHNKKYKYWKYTSNDQYCSTSPDNITVLDSIDDAAAVNWEGHWHTPTYEEQDELFRFCTWVYTTQNGVNGQLVTGPNGNSIFLPAAGSKYLKASESGNNLSTNGYYRSASRNPNETNTTFSLTFTPQVLWIVPSSRDYGNSVRPVCSSYVFTLLDYLGTAYLAENHIEDDIITEPNPPAVGACSDEYEFVGWSEKEVELGSQTYTPVSFPYTMPDHKVTLYPVYKLGDLYTTSISTDTEGPEDGTVGGIGVFSVSATKLVTFAPGNLQYTHATPDVWSFASEQYEILGTDNVVGGSITKIAYENGDYGYEKTSATKIADKIDLFYWSETKDHQYGVSITSDANDVTGTFVEWGNLIIGNYKQNTWRTLTYEEWRYLVQRKDAHGNPLYGVAKITNARVVGGNNGVDNTGYGVNGVILLPDNWVCPSGINFKSGVSPGKGMTWYDDLQQFTLEQWKKMEAAGAVFLPAAGYRGTYKMYNVQYSCGYWSSSSYSTTKASHFGFNSKEVYVQQENDRNSGRAVRLAQDTLPIQVDPTTTKVTSTAGQTVRKSVRINISDLITRNATYQTTTITGTSDNPAFNVVALNYVGPGERDLIVEYRPTATADGIETATITLSSSTLEGHTSFKMTGRHLAQNFVIAAKAGNEWVAMTAKVSNGTQVAVPIKVDNTETPTKATIALNTCQYQLFGLKDRFNANGTAVHLYSTQTQKVLNASTSTTTKTYLNTDATHQNAETSSNALFYEWQLVTSDLIHYAITNCNTQNTENRVLGYSSSTGEWGLYQSSNVVNQEVFLLPIETTLTEKDIEVMEWGTNSMSLRFGETAPANMNVILGETTTNVTLTNLNSSDIYLVDNLSGLTNNDHEVMVISYNGQGTIVRKPILVSDDVVSTNYSTLTHAHRDVVVLNGGKLNAGSAYVDFANIYVYPGGKLVLDGKSLGVKQQVYLRGGYSWLNQTTYALPEVYLNGTINFNGSGNMIYDYYIQNYKYYQFCLPYTVPLANVTDEAGVDNFPVWVKHYNGALRAANAYATSWEYYNGDNFEAGKGYIIAAKPRQVDNVKNRPLSIIRFPLGNNSITSSEADKSVATIAHGIDGYKDGTVTANNVGWNFVGNPFLATWKGDIGHKRLEMHYENGKWDGSYHWVDSGVKYITVMSAESGSDYAQYVAKDTELQPFFPFYMQETAEGGKGTINFAATGRMKKAPIMLSAKTKREAFVQIEIMADGEKDQTGMFIGEHYSDDIDFDDYEKMFGSSTDNTKLWLMHEGKRMAFEAMTESTAAAYTPLGYRAPKKGTYYMDVNLEVSDLTDVEAIYLSDNLAEVSDYDLLEGAYEFESDATTYNDNRFVVRVVLRNEAPGTATDIENIIGIHSDSESPCKFIYQNRMYILRNGIIYDTTGQQVLTIEK